MFISASLYFAFTWRWPLVGDASLIHYICFLMDHGMAPYRDLGDMNMPGSFLLEWAVMHTLGNGAIAWRIYDFLLMLVAVIAMVSIGSPYGWFPGLFGSALFVLVHGRDGLAQGGQRDLTMAIVLLLATAFLFRSLRQHEIWPAAIFGLLAGIAITIKPTAILFAIGLLGLAAYAEHRRGRQYAGLLWASLSALLIGPGIAAAFLLKEASVASFFAGLRTVVPYYSSLGHRPLGYLLTHSISPLPLLLAVWVILLIAMRPHLDWERAALLAGAAFGLISYIVQARGFPYYRYPLFAFLLPLIAIDLTKSLSRDTPKFAQRLALLGIVIGGLVIAPISARMLLQYDWRNLDFITSLQANLSHLGGPELSGHVQCIDSISGCGTTLYRMKLVQSTGMLSDFLLFGPDSKPVIHSTREKFLQQIEEKPPRVIVISSFLHIEGPDGYAKLDRWPAFRDYLMNRYCEVADWSPSRPQKWWSRAQWPDGYRIYVLKGMSSKISSGVGTN
jgi:Dolichyl-phosphate-mannose-protein mannosyltransferase